MKTNSRKPKRPAEAKTSRTAKRKGDSRAASGSEWERYVKIVASMGMDAWMGHGPTKRAFVKNLRTIADNMEKLLPNESSSATADPNA